MPSVGLQIVTPGRSRYAGYRVLPVPGCLYWAYYGQSLDQSSINDVKNSQNATVVGDPSVSDEYISIVGKQDYLQTTVSDTTAMTVFVIARSTDTHETDPFRPTFIGNVAGLDSRGFALIVSASTTLRLDVGVDQSSGPEAVVAPMVVPTINEWHCYAGAFDEEGVDLYNLTDGQTRLDAPTGPRAVGSTPITVGGGATALRSGTADIMHASIWGRRLSGSEITRIYETMLKPWAAAGGIAI